MSNTTIVCKDIVKYFGEGDRRIEVLKKVSFSAVEDELILLMGPSGSGKSTLLSIIGGILSQDAGECIILNESINDMPHSKKTAFRGKNIGFIFQSFNLIPTLSIVENAALPLMLNGMSAREAFVVAEMELEKMGLKGQLYQEPAVLSGGEQQRVALVRAYIHKPKIILCDEPTSYLDHERGKQVMLMLQAIKKEHNCTLIVVTHDPRILEFADRILRIEDGMISEAAK